jgi:glycosyltransferase involved in cell wall biosynthesis
MMKKLLFITPELPFPCQSGGKVKSMKLLQFLAERYQVTYVSPLKQEDGQHLQAFKAASPCTEHLVAPVDVPRSAPNLMLSYLEGQPLNVRRTLDKGLRDRVADIAHDYDVVFLDHYEVFTYLPPDYQGLVVYHAHNAYFKIWERYASLPGNPALRAAAFLEARRVRRYEAAVAERASLVFAAPNDACELVASGVEPERISDTYHLGDDTHLELPELRFEQTEKKIMYVGFLGWEPNVQGLLWFIDKVWPGLAARHPDLRFDIVGKNPDERLREVVALHDGIRLTGYVADLDTVYRDSRVSVAPLTFGSGMKVKVLDAMARGIPTVTTSVGAEGIDIVNGQHLLVADDPAEMKGQIESLLENAGLWHKLQAGSRALIRERYTWRQLFNGMHRDLERALKAHGSASRPFAGELVNAG